MVKVNREELKKLSQLEITKCQYWLATRMKLSQLSVKQK